MPFVPASGVIEVQSVYLLDGQIVENTCYVFNTVPWDEASITAMLETIKNVIVTQLLPILSNTIHLVRLIGTLLDAIDSISVVNVVSPPQPGGDASQALPNNVTYTVTFLTSGRGRSSRGRNYVPGLAAAARSGANGIDAGFRSDLLSYYDALLAAVNTGTTTLGVLSRFSGVDADKKPIPRTEGVFRGITGFTTFDNTIDSQRRRLPGRGA